MYQHYILGKYDLSPKQAGHLLYQMFPENFKISWLINYSYFQL
ncbi:hypothetical protein [Faecalibacillus intestinalis]